MNNSLLHILFFLCLWSLDLRAQCNLSSPVDIPPETTTDLNIEVSNLTNNLLGINQSICAVYIELEHGRLENLRFNLISPSGQYVSLIGPGTASGAFTSLINWNVSFLPCNGPVSPDSNFTDVWSNDQRWEVSGRYTGSYYPHFGCLEDFNIGSANGEWTLEIVNQGTNSGKLIYFELLFCDQTGLDCRLCNPIAGDFDNDFLLLCEGDPSLNDLAPNFEAVLANNEFAILSIESNNGIPFQFAESFDRLDTLDSGIYTLCGIVAEQNKRDQILAFTSSAELDGFISSEACAVATEQCMTIEIKAVAELIIIEQFLCAGDTTEVLGIPFYQSKDTTIYNTGAMGQLPCDTATRIIIEELTIDVELDFPAEAIFCGQNLVLRDRGSVIGGGNPTYVWFRNDIQIPNPGPIIQIDSGGIYRLEVKVESCSESDTIDIRHNNQIENTIIIEPRSCASDSFFISNMVNVQGVPFDLELTALEGPSGLIPLPGSAENFYLLEKGEYNMILEIGDCSLLDTFTLEDNLVPLNLNATVEDSIDCSGLPVSMELLTNVQNPSFEFSGPEEIPNGTLAPEVSTPGIYTIIVTDLNQCSEEITVEVFANAEFPVISVIDINQICSSSSPVTLTAMITGDIDSLVWQGEDGSTYYGNGTEVNEPGLYTISAYGSNGCVSSAELKYAITNEPGLLSSENYELLCIGDSLILENDIPLSAEMIVWTEVNGEVISTGNALTIREAGNYTLLVTDANGCTGEKFYNISDERLSPNLFDFDFETIYEDCGLIPKLRYLGYLYPVGAIFVDEVPIPIAQEFEVSTGNLEIRLEDTNGCSHIYPVEVLPNVLPVIELGPDITLDLGESYDIPMTINNPNTGTWNFDWSDESILSCTDCFRPVANPQETTTLILEVTDTDGCSAIDTLIITVISEPSEPIDTTVTIGGIYIPDVFLPGSAGENDRLIIGIDTGLYATYEFMIYDRWGNLVATDKAPVTNPTISFWDGYYKGSPAMSGVYVYMAKFLHLSGSMQLRSGHISLLR